MTVFLTAIFLAVFLCALVAGFLFAFAAVVLPGIRKLPDREFIQAFRAIDGVIQNNSPLFMLVWVGSVAVLLVAVALGIGYLAGADLGLLILAAALYVLGVQAPTVTINIPLNNRLQAYEVATMSDAQLQAARTAFETRWNRWNVIRTGFACLTVIVLLVLLVRA